MTHPITGRRLQWVWWRDWQGIGWRRWDGNLGEALSRIYRGSIRLGWLEVRIWR